MPTSQELKELLNKTLKQEVAVLGNHGSLNDEYWPTGMLPIDALLGGGFQKGRMALLAGESATLKSMIGLAAAGQVLKAGGTAALIDTEHAFNQVWSEKLGIDNDNLILSRPETGELAIDEMEVLVRNGIDYICMDSIAALLPRSERELMLSGKDHNQPARIAALMAVGLRKLNAANENTTIVWISQLRDNIGAMAFAPKNVVTGGKAIHYFISQNIMLRKVGKLYQEIKYFNGDKFASDKQVVAQQFRAELGKSRSSSPFKLQHFNFDLQVGEIDHTQYLIQQGLDMGIVQKADSGAMWNLNIVDDNGEILREDKFRGKDAFKEGVENDPEILDALNKAVAGRYNFDPELYKTW